MAGRGSWESMFQREAQAEKPGPRRTRRDQQGSSCAARRLEGSSTGRSQPGQQQLSHRGAQPLQQPHRMVPAWHHTHQRPPRGSGVLAEATCVSPGFPSRTMSDAHTRHTPAGGSELLALRTTLALFPAPFCSPITVWFSLCVVYVIFAC